MITTTIRTLTLNHPFSLPLSLPLLYRISTLTTMNDFGVLRKRFGRYEEVTLNTSHPINTPLILISSYTC